MSEYLEYYLSFNLDGSRDYQATMVDKIIEQHFNFDYVECIETGVSSGNYDDFITYLGKLCELKGGVYHSVDNNEDKVKQAIKNINKKLPNLNFKVWLDDSVNYLKNYVGKPNIVLLDSYDFDPTNPFMSMLHHYNEFLEIKDKMPIGSLIIVDDNYMKDSIIYYNLLYNGELKDTIVYNVTYELYGKGTLIYEAIKENKFPEWELISKDYHIPGVNLKLVLKKKDGRF